MPHQRLRWTRVLAAFVPVMALLFSCPVSIFRFLSPTATLDVGFLEVNIDYNDDFYVDTFGYSRQAANIKHFVLVVPESEANRASPDAIFTRLRFPTHPDDALLEAGSEEFAWALDYLYAAPEGRFKGEFAPGRYFVAVAFIAAPVSREESGYGDDVILWPGITGGGASTDFQEVAIEPGETTSLEFMLTDANGWACPWLYVYNGRDFERRTEILRNLRGRQNERTEVSLLGLVKTVDGAIILKVAEERAEISFIDELYITVDGVKVRAEGEPHVAAQVAERDQDYWMIARGESSEFRFRLPGSLASREQTTVSVVVSGFYVSLE